MRYFKGKQIQCTKKKNVFLEFNEYTKQNQIFKKILKKKKKGYLGIEEMYKVKN